MYGYTPAKYNEHALLPSHTLYETVIEQSGHQRKEGRSNRHISIQFNASRMKKNDPALPTWNTLKAKLFSS